MRWMVVLAACGAASPSWDPGPGAAVERWPDGTPRAEGATDAGSRHGIWTWWAEDGSFQARAGYREGVLHGPLLQVGLDGRVVELTLREGAVVGFRTLPPGAPMPEWEGDRRVEGARYARRVGASP